MKLSVEPSNAIGEMVLPVDDDVPLPPNRGIVPRTVRNLQVGESFVVYSHGELTNAYITARNLGIVIKSKKEKDSEERRIWRVS